MSGNKTDLNLRGDFLHMAADALVSLGVVIAGAMFIWTGWVSAISMVIAVVILWSTWDLLRQSLHLSLDGVSVSIQLDKVKNYLTAQPNVIEIHYLDVWAMSTSEIALTVHLVMREGHPGNEFLCRVAEELHDNFTIGHVTIQIELDKHHCSLSGHTQLALREVALSHWDNREQKVDQSMHWVERLIFSIGKKRKPVRIFKLAPYFIRRK